jgi:hypothetical protein
VPKPGPDLAHEQLGNGHTGPAREEAYVADAPIDDDDLRDRSRRRRAAKGTIAS